jgi:ferric-dicitrate binding protein FerR (iron transport regulator)
MEEVATEFNRYNTLQIRIEDPSIRARMMNGVFNADEPQALLKFLAGEPGIAIERSGEDVVVRRIDAAH